MSSEVKRRILRVFGAHSLGGGITLLDRVLTVALLLHYWGVALYGEWLIIRAIPAYLAVVELGFANVAGNGMTRAVARSGFDDALAIYQSNWVLTSIVSMVLLSLVVLLSMSLPVSDLLGLKVMRNENDILVTLVALALYTVAIFYTQLLNAGFRAEANHFQGVLLTHMVRAAELLAAIVIVVSGGAATELAVGYCAVRLLGNVTMSIYLRSRSPWLRLGFTSARWILMKQAFMPGLSFAAIPFASILNLQATILLVGKFLGGEAVAMFSVARLLARSIVQYGAQINRTVWPEVSIAYSNNDAALVKTLSLQAGRFALWGALLAAIAILSFGPYIIEIWTNNSITVSLGVLALIVSMVTINCCWDVIFATLLAVGRHKRIAFVILLCTVLGISTAYYAIQEFGLVGMICAAIIADTMILFVVIRAVALFLNEPVGSYIFQILRFPQTKDR